MKGQENIRKGSIHIIYLPTFVPVLGTRWEEVFLELSPYTLPPFAPGDEHHFFWITVKHMNFPTIWTMCHIDQASKEGSWPWKQSQLSSSCVWGAPMPKSVHYWKLTLQEIPCLPLHLSPVGSARLQHQEISSSLHLHGFCPSHWWHLLDDDNILPSPSAGVCSFTPHV